MHTFKSTDVTEVTLLSIEEAKVLPEEILDCGKWWWLRSPGDGVSNAAFVFSDGSLFEFGYYVFLDSGAVRPAFLIPNLKSSNLKIGDVIEVAGIKSFVISDDMALAKDPVGCTAFHKNWKAKNANDYEMSDAKKWLEDWWKR